METVLIFCYRNETFHVHISIFYIYVHTYLATTGGPWLSGRVLASGPVGPGIDTPPGH